MQKLTNLDLSKHLTVVVDPETGKVTERIDYLTADEEDNYVVAQANARLDDDGSFLDEDVVARFRGENTVIRRDRIRLYGCITKTSCICRYSMYSVLRE